VLRSTDPDPIDEPTTSGPRYPASPCCRCTPAPRPIRLSVGLADADDLIADLARALKLAQKGA
jgi:cystathionine beta-lyase/cystathionine gamma-synthase